MEKKKEYNLPIEETSITVNEPQRNWGGPWTEEKLDAFEKYVKAYLTIMKKHATENGWTLFYFDAFAGSGSRESETEEKIKAETSVVMIMAAIKISDTTATICFLRFEPLKLYICFTSFIK